jgi:hypothetical protein
MQPPDYPPLRKGPVWAMAEMSPTVIHVVIPLRPILGIGSFNV